MKYNGAMTIRSIVTTLGIIFLSTQFAVAEDAAVRVLVSNGMKGAIEELQPQLEKAAGRPLSIEYSSTAALKKRIEGGEDFDATVITIEAITDLIKQGKLAGASRVDFARSQLGIGIRSGSSKPDIHSTEALKRTFLDAKSITYPQDGASRGFIDKMFEKMGIASDVKPKIILAPGSGPAAESVAAGKAAMVITLFSEIVPTHGIEILGALPGDYQYDIRFGAATSAKAKDAAASKKLIAFLAGPKTAAVFKAKGLESIPPKP